MKKLLTHWIKALVLITFVLSGNMAYSQFLYSVQNLGQTSSNTLEFDVYLLDTDDSETFELASSQLGFLFNSLIYTGGSVTVTIDNTGSGLNSLQQFTASPQAVSPLSGYPDQTLIRLAGRTPPGAGNGTIISTSGDGTLLTHFTITSTVDFVGGTTPDLTFCSSTVSSPLYPTRVSEYVDNVNTAYVVTAGATAVVNDNPVLNPLPTAYDVTGTGSYCQGTGGLPVGLSGSQIGVTYTLYRGGIAQTPTVEGTGSAITFGNQLEGTYTVTGTNISGTVTMNGSAVITENATPSSPVVSIDCTLGAGNAVVTVTSPTGAGLEYSLDGGAFQAGTSFSGVDNGNHSITVRTSAGCTTTGPTFVVSCGCANPPTISLSSTSGSTCGINPITVSGNTFGGSATAVTITENGGGTVTPTLSGTSPFSFTYTPVAGDAGSVVVITVTTDNPLGLPCEAATATYSLTVNALPSAPLIGSITQPTCGVATGSVILSGLPASGVWTLTRSPGNVTTTGTGTSTTITGLAAGTYTFTVTNANGCLSGPSSNVVINAQPPTPTAPVVGSIIAPTCSVSTGSVTLEGLPSTGTWIITRSPGGITTTGTGVTTTISLLPAGSYTFTVTNSYGCNSPSSAVVVIPTQPPTPTAPVVGAITAPTCTEPTGSVVLSGLPATGTWTITRYTGGVTTTGTGTSTTITGLPTGTYNFTVTNEDGCVSPLSANVVIPSQPDSPAAPVIGTITQPTCFIATGSVVLSGLPATGTWTLTRNPGAVTTAGTGTSTTVTLLPSGTYTFTVTNEEGCVSLPSANVVINAQPATPTAPIVGAITHPGCTLATGSVVLSGLPTTGTWTITASPGGATTTGTGPSSTVSGLAAGVYTFTVTNSDGCISPPSATVVINDQPPLPDAPTHSIDCSLGFGNAIVTVISPTGSGYTYSMDGGTFQSNTSFTGIANGSHTITVRNSYGCTTVGTSFDVSCGCANPPTITLSSTSGSVCGTTPIIVSGNTFGGSATTVTITENGAGTVTPSSTTTSPFSFTYTPAASDMGNVVTITLTSDNPLGAPCAPVSVNYALTVNPTPEPPTIGTVTQPTCDVATGSVLLYGLPSSGTWSLLILPTYDVVTGTGSTTTITDLNPSTYTFTVTNATDCVSDPSVEVTINDQPPLPEEPYVQSITQPTCATSTASVVLTGLPSTGTWIVRRTPGSVSTTGTGETTTISGIPAGGVYTFTVTNSFGCTSSQSNDANIFPQPETPAAPSVGTITPPTCSDPTGSVTLFGLPADEAWVLTQYPGTITIYGTGASITLDDLESGTYNYTVTNEAGCISDPSENIIIPAQPPTPSPPEIGTVTQPTYAVPTGSVELRELPYYGQWIVIRDPGNVTTTGEGPTTLITGLEPGVFTFRVTNDYGCTSLRSAEVTISTPGVPTLVITDPNPVCFPSTVDITTDTITEGSTPGLTYTYWEDSECTIEYETPTETTGGIYYIRGTTISGFFDIKPVVVTVVPPPLPNAGTDQVLNYVFDTQLNASLEIGEKGTWQVIKGSGEIENDTIPVTSISGLSLHENIIRWTVTNSVCPPVADTLTITVNDLIIPTLITPNLDGKNDYFVLRGLVTLGRTELLIFDRRGILVYKNSNYDNEWDGVDQKGNPLPADTYFYSIRPGNGQPYNGYIVIER